MSNPLTIRQFHSDDVWRDEDGNIWVRLPELVTFAKDNAGLRADVTDLRTQLAEAEAVIAEAIDVENHNSSKPFMWIVGAMVRVLETPRASRSQVPPTERPEA